MGPRPECPPPGHHARQLPLPELPPPSVDKREVLALPIRVVCGNDEPVQGFVPDPNMVDGATNGKKVKIDTSAANAAPEAVYQSERYSQDFSYIFEVPKDGRYLVRLHFAESLTANPAQRVENISINGKAVLPDFDILKAAGAMNKAVVKEFNDVAPDKEGTLWSASLPRPRARIRMPRSAALKILRAGQ